MMTWRDRAAVVPALPGGYLEKLAFIESGNNPRAQNPNSSAKGLYQFIDSTAQQYGITDPFDVNQQTSAVTRFTADNAMALRKVLGRDPTPGELYLAHQQGAGGAAKLLSNPNARAVDIVGADAIKLNGGSENMTAQEFASKWLGKFDGAPQYSSQTFSSSGGRNMNMALMQPSNTGSDWRSRAKPVEIDVTNQVSTPAKASDWRSRAKPVEEPGFVDRVKNVWSNAEKQYQDAAVATATGQQSVTEGALQAAMAKGAVVPNVIGEALMSLPGAETVANAVGKGVEFVGKAPMIGGGTLGEAVKRDAGAVWDSMSPRTQRNVQAAGNALNIGTMLLGGTAAKQAAKSDFVRELGEDLVTPVKKTPQFPGDKVPATEVDLKKMAGQEYDTSEYLGGKFPTTVSDDFDRTIKSLEPKPVAGKNLTEEDKTFLNNLKEFQGLKGANLSLEDVKRLDEQLTQKINSKFLDARTGQPDTNGRKLMILQTKLRNLADEADVAGNDALVNGRTLWKAQAMMNDIDAIFERASYAKDRGEALRTGAKSLLLDKDRIRGWPDDTKELLKEMATPGVGTDILDALGSRLIERIMGGTGNIPGAATMHVVGGIARGAKEARMARRGAKVQQSIVDDAMGKLRDYTVPEPDLTPLQLAAPDKMGPLPMTDTQINIARKLMDRPTSAPTDTVVRVQPPRQLPAPGTPTPAGVGSGMTDRQINVAKEAIKDRSPKPTAEDAGAAVKPPVSQLTNLRQRIGVNKARELDRMSEMLKAGDMSQNTFVREATIKFKLKQSQARSLAREIVSNGEKK